MAVRSVDLSRDETAIRTNIGGRTALYDAVEELVKMGKKHHAWRKRRGLSTDVIYEVLVVTDGADNASERTLQQCKALVASPKLPNFNFVLLAVGISDAAASVMRDLCHRPRHCHFTRVADAAALGQKIAEIGNKIKMTHELRSSSGFRTRTVVQCRTKDASAAFAVLADHTDLASAMRHLAPPQGGGRAAASSSHRRLK